jgi:aminopeptidase N
MKMNKFNIIILSYLSVVIFACAAKKNTASTAGNNDPVINLDTLTVTAGGDSKEPEPKIYRAANTKLSDLLHTKLEVRFDWANSWLYGKATIDIKPYFYKQSKLFLNARGMDIYKVQLLKDKVYSDLKYAYENDSLKIELDREYTRNDKYTVCIEYKSKPNDLKSGGSRAINSDKGLYFINPKGEDKNKMPQIWTQGETQSNSAWFPTVDSPNERMTDEIYITVDDKYTTLSNGDLTEQIKNSDGTRTDHWKMDLPHAPYLVMMGVGEFKVVKDKKWNGKEVNYYVEKEYEPYAKAIFGNTPEMIEFYSTKLGVPYAWTKYAQIVARDYVSGAMENTTATLHGDFVYQTDRELLDGSRGEDVISHELFHQWFGDLVTCESWSNLPLNESFATYGEYLWEEYKYGLDAADAHSYESRMGYLAEASQKQEDLIRFDVEQREDMFDGHSYNKGGQVLHMLRKYVGDEAFFASLKLYLERNKFTSVEIHNLRLAFEEVTGEDLNWFFNQWFLSSGHPELDIKYVYDGTAKKITINVQQQQDFKTTPLFRIPLYVDIYSEGKVQREKIVITKAKQDFAFDAATKPSLVNFDAEKQLLCRKNENKSMEEYIFQYKNAPKFLDRLEALQAFKGNLGNAPVYNTVKEALKDKWSGNRKLAINMLQDIAAEKEEEVKPILIAIAKSDEKTKVRAEAIEFLAANYKGDDLKQLYQQSVTDKSYAVMGSSLSALALIDPVSGLAKAKELENETSDNVRYAVMDVYAEHGGDAQNDYFVKNKDSFTGFEVIGFLNLYGAFLKKCSDDIVISGTTLMKDYAKGGSNVYVKYYAQKAIKDQLNRYQDKEDELTVKLEEIKKGKGDVTATQQLLDKVITTKNKLKEIYNQAQ